MIIFVQYLRTLKPNESVKVIWEYYCIGPIYIHLWNYIINWYALEHDEKSRSPIHGFISDRSVPLNRFISSLFLHRYLCYFFYLCKLNVLINLRWMKYISTLQQKQYFMVLITSVKSRRNKIYFRQLSSMLGGGVWLPPIWPSPFLSGHYVEMGVGFWYSNRPYDEVDLINCKTIQENVRVSFKHTISN